MARTAKARKTGAAPAAPVRKSVGVYRRARAAPYCGVSVPQFDRLIASGKGPKKVRLGGRCFGFRPEDLDEWLAARVEPAKATV